MNMEAPDLDVSKHKLQESELNGVDWQKELEQVTEADREPGLLASVPGRNCVFPGTVVPGTVSLQEHVPSCQSPNLPVTSTPPVEQSPSPNAPKKRCNETATERTSASPREEHGDMSPAVNIKSTKTRKDPFEARKFDCYSEVAPDLDVSKHKLQESELNGVDWQKELEKVTEADREPGLLASVPGRNCDFPGTVVPGTVSLQEHVPSCQSRNLPVTSTPPVEQSPSPSAPKKRCNETATERTSASPREEHGDMSPSVNIESTKTRKDPFEARKFDCYSEDAPDMDVSKHKLQESELNGVDWQKELEKVTEADREPGLLASVPCRNCEFPGTVVPGTVSLQEHVPICQSRNLPVTSTPPVEQSPSPSAPKKRCNETATERTSASPREVHGDMSPAVNTESTKTRKDPFEARKFECYNEDAPDLDDSRSTALLQQNIQELRKAFMTVKADLDCIGRQIKKLRQKEK